MTILSEKSNPPNLKKNPNIDRLILNNFKKR